MAENGKLCVVFLVEPEASVRNFVEDILHEHGSLVFSASSATSALHFLRGYQDDIHLAMVGEYVPGANGVELAELIARERPNTRVVLMVEASRAEAPRGWEGQLLTKPLDAAALRKHVEEALETIPCDTVPPPLRTAKAGK